MEERQVARGMRVVVVVVVVVAGLDVDGDIDTVTDGLLVASSGSTS